MGFVSKSQEAEYVSNNKRGNIKGSLELAALKLSHKAILWPSRQNGDVSIMSLPEADYNFF